nr:SH3 domain-containing protein C23A1.17-like [Aegilops tauschii subsp. strangulata]
MPARARCGCVRPPSLRPAAAVPSPAPHPPVQRAHAAVAAPRARSAALVDALLSARPRSLSLSLARPCLRARSRSSPRPLPPPARTAPLWPLRPPSRTCPDGLPAGPSHRRDQSVGAVPVWLGHGHSPLHARLCPACRRPLLPAPSGAAPVLASASHRSSTPAAALLIPCGLAVASPLPRRCRAGIFPLAVAPTGCVQFGRPHPHVPAPTRACVPDKAPRAYDRWAPAPRTKKMI